MTVAALATLHLLGSPHLRLQGREHPLTAGAPGLLLACLALHGVPVARERVAVLFWPDAGAAQAQHRLRITLHRSRQWLAGFDLAGQLQADRQRLHLALPHDLGRFRDAVAGADWAAAAALQGAALLDGFEGAQARGLPDLEDWLADERAALRAQWRDAARREADRLCAGGQAEAGAALLLRLLRDDLLAEDTLQALLRVAAAAGQREQALALHERYSRLAHSELGLQPMAQTQALAEALRQHRVAPAAPAPQATGLTPMRLAQPPLVGRAAEMAVLGHSGARLCVVSGEPGVGKTRLLAERWPEALWWRCRPGLQGVPLLPVAEALQQLAGDPTHGLQAAIGDDESTRQELARLVPALAPGELLPPADPASPRLLLALARVLPRLLARSGGTLVVDDLQWIDSGSLQLLRLLLATTTLPVRATLRPGEVPPAVARWLDEERAAGRHSEIPLLPLSADGMAALLAMLAGEGAPRLAAWLQRVTGGNPFFTLETLRALFESGQLRDTGDGWVRPLEGTGDEFRLPPLPPRVAALVQQRLAALPEPAQRVLQAAAVLGHARHEDLLAPMLGLSPWATAEALGRGQQAGLMRGPEFAHELAREAVLAATAAPLQRVLHTSAVRHAVVRGNDLLGPHRRALHAWAAGMEAQAVQATLEAAQHDRALGLLAEGEALLNAALSRAQARALQAQLELELAECLECAGDHVRADAHARRAAELGDDPTLRAQALATCIVVHLHQGRLADAQALFAEVQALGVSWPDQHTIGAKLAHAAGDFGSALSHMHSHVALLRQRGASADLASALSGLATAMAAQGALAESVPLHREAIAMAQRFKALYFQCYATSNYLWTAARLADGHAAAAALGRQALKLGEYAPSKRLRVNLGSVLQRLGALEEAELLYEQQAGDESDPTVAAVCWARLVDVRAARGADVHETVERALALLARTEAPVARAAIVIAALELGDAGQVERGLQACAEWPLAADQQQRLQAARARHAAGKPRKATTRVDAGRRR